MIQTRAQTLLFTNYSVVVFFYGVNEELCLNFDPMLQPISFNFHKTNKHPFKLQN